MKIAYPKDAPQWLQDIIEHTDDAVRGQLMDVTPSTENLLIARGASQLLRKIVEEIDMIGRVEMQTAKELAEEMTKRG